MAINSTPTNPPVYQAAYNQATGTWDVVQAGTNAVSASGLSQQEALILANNQTLAGEGENPSTAPANTPVVTSAGQVANNTGVADDSPLITAKLQTEPAVYSPKFNSATNSWEVVNQTGAVVAGGLTEQESILFAQDQVFADENVNVPTGSTPTAPSSGFSTQADQNAAQTQAAIKNAQQQQTIAQQRKQINNSDWRVRLRLAPQSRYLYNAPNPGIMQPLQVTDGVIFPYTPSIDTAYRANYDAYDLTHSNYRGYFYKNSYVDEIRMKCEFTAQDTSEANYLLAVITFFKSVTKMFYGQDAERGAPPPLVYLTGLGEYQYNEHPCLVKSFDYSLPSDVDYIRAGSSTVNGTNLLTRRDRQSVSNNTLFGSLNRLAAALLPKGAQVKPPGPPTLGLNRPTYVPTKIDINLTLLPVQTRQQVSKQFSVKEFANGNLIKGGFW